MFKGNCCKQCRHVKFKGTMTKWTVQKHLKHYDQPLILCFIWIHPFLFIKVIELTISVTSSEKDASSSVNF